MNEIATANFPDFSFRIELDDFQETQGHMLELLKSGRIYESESKFLYEHLRPYDRFIDVGAHVGWYSLLAAKCCERIHVMAFEPERENYQRLVRNIELNKLKDRIAPYACAVGRERGKATLYLNADNDGGHSLWDAAEHPSHEKTRKNPQSYEVDLVRLIDYWPMPFNGGRVWLKIDAEGAEAEVLSTVLGKAEPQPWCVIAEINPFALRQLGSSEGELRGMLYDRGYKSYAHSKDKLIAIKRDEHVSNPGLVHNMIFCVDELPCK